MAKIELGPSGIQKKERDGDSKDGVLKEEKDRQQSIIEENEPRIEDLENERMGDKSAEDIEAEG
jgi:hypothetical protein